jgi:hypothetical protein
MERKIYDQQGNLLDGYDETKGYLQQSTRSVHHEAVEAVQEVWHYETVKEYPNGGKDVQKVIDIQGVQAVPAWDEEIPVYIYVPYTDEELAAMEAEKNKPSQEQRIAELEAALEMILSGVVE